MGVLKMGLLDKAINVLEDIQHDFSNDSFTVGLRFEEYVNSLFNTKYFAIAEKTHSTKTNQEQYVESSMNPDFVYRYKPTNELFAVECKYRSGLNEDGMLSWSYPKQLKRYQEFQFERNIPVFVVIGFRGYDDEPDDMFCIPLNEAKYPDLYPSVFNRYSRNPKKHFFWKDGVLS